MNNKMWKPGKHCTTINQLREKLKYLCRVDDNGCWLYIGPRFSNGYGSVKYRGRTYQVHRISIEIFKGEILDIDEQVNHIRECPNKHCFNPDHLYKGSQKENMIDRWSGHTKLTKNMKNSKYYRKHNQHRKNFSR